MTLAGYTTRACLCALDFFRKVEIIERVVSVDCTCLITAGPLVCVSACFLGRQRLRECLRPSCVSSTHVCALAPLPRGFGAFRDTSLMTNDLEPGEGKEAVFCWLLTALEQRLLRLRKLFIGLTVFPLAEKKGK